MGTYANICIKSNTILHDVTLSIGCTDTPHYENVPFEIPASWEWVRLEDYVSKVTDFVASGSFASLRENVTYYKEENYAILVRTADFGSNFNKDLVYTDKHGYEFLENSNLVGGELILPNIGASIGKVFIVPKLSKRMTLGPNSILIRTLEENMTIYLYYSFLSLWGYNLLHNISSATAQGKFNKTDLKKVILPIPPYFEQKRIIKAIKDWFSQIDNLDKDIADIQDAIKQTKLKILDLAIHGKLVPQDPNDEPAIDLLKRINPSFKPCDTSHYENLPASWCVCKVETIADVISGVSYDKSDVQRSGIKILRGGNIQDGKIVEQDDDVYISEKYINESNSIKYGDIILVASTGSQTLIGKTGFAPKAYHHTQIGAFLRIIRAKDSSLCEYLNYVFLSDTFRKHIRELASGTNINNVKNKYITDFILALPPQNEIPRIIKKVNDIFKSLDTITAEL